jgi:uncharacterized protein (DUF1697 family)
MTIYIALLRGINVGGKNKIKMAELRNSLETMDLERVQTYIQSGNILFESNESEEQLRFQMEQKIEKDFGFLIPVILRTAAELDFLAGNCPFSEEAVAEAEAASEVESLYVSLLLEAPSNEAVENLSAYRSELDEYRINGRDVYLLFHRSVRNSKLASNLQKLDVPMTMRNWKTINKLNSLAKAMEI